MAAHRRLCLLMALVAGLVFALMGGARAQTVFEKLVMPGQLIEGHAKLEKDCANCHEPFSKSAQSRLCLDCHKDIAKDRSQTQGFHGKHPNAAKSDCNRCHTDHKGRAADVVQLDKETFNHTFTDFMLNGAHKQAVCESCHKPKVKFRLAPSQCIDCHKKDDHHKGRLGTACNNCHNETSWSKAQTFDHAKTRFPLVGTHAKVTCAACHPNEKYKGVPTVCASCHQLQDVHQGRYGAKCDTCHEPKTWKTLHFDHAKATRFSLRGKHATATCDACHKGDLYRDKLQMACVSCHKKDDAHKGQLGQSCGQCHNESGWRQKVAYDHDLTRFPLLGKHAVVPCEECHKSTSFKDTPSACVSCHKGTHHEGRLGANCGLCHTPNGWAIWRFDHDRQTRFKLTGAHTRASCHGCHTQKYVTKISQASACYSCHASDDAHQGNFGRNCETCHNTTAFK